MTSAAPRTVAGAPGPAGSPHWPALDGVRGIAVLVVVLFHLPFAWARQGFAGVDVFFALSGFLITALLLRERADDGRIDLPAFYARRVLRLAPALVLLIAGVLGLALVSGRLESVLPGAVAAMLYLSNWWIYTGHDAPLLEHTWTLSIEEHFYLIWPVILIGLLSARRWARPLAYVGIGAICALLAVSWPDFWDGVRQSYLRGVPIVFGCVVALVVRRPARSRWVMSLSKGLGPALLVGLLAVLLLPTVPDWLPMSGPTSVPGILAALLVLSLVAVPETTTSQALAWAPLRWTGRRAYGIYLFHFPMISLAMHQVDLGLAVEVRATLAALASFGVAAASYRWVEMPFLRLKKRLVRRPVTA